MGRNTNKRPGKKGHTSAQQERVRTFYPEQDSTLLEFVITKLKDQSRTTIKSLLSRRHIAINGRAITQFDTPVHTTDEVSVNFDRSFTHFKHPMFRIVFEDEYLIVIDKNAGLLSMGTDRDKERTAYFILNQYVKKRGEENRIYIVHRLDRETSGLMMFAKSLNVQARLQENWDKLVTDRRYVAVVEGLIPEEKGELRSYLAENSAMNVYTTDEAHGKLAITRYRRLASKGKFTLVELELETGRKNQIRAQMQDFGYPLVGDKKYGAHSNPMGRLMLHANKLEFFHPMTRQKMLFETPVPAKFKQLM